MYCYAGRILRVDLGAERWKAESVDEATLQRYLGGVGLGVRLLLDNSKPEADPLGPENAIVIANSCLAGTLMPAASKCAFVTKSPLTGLLNASLSGSFFAQALQHAGWDAIVITGKAKRPTYLFVDDDRVFFRSAEKLAGMECFDTEEAIRGQIDDEMVRVASIGPAGERLVRYASVGNDKGRQAARGGTGAVMGAKGLKAIAVRGSKPLQVADRSEMLRLCLEYGRRSQGPATEQYRAPGTVGRLAALNTRGVLPVRNFQAGVFAHAEDVSGERMMRSHTEKTLACAGCSIACEQVARSGAGPYEGARVSIGYESLYALGPACGVRSLDAIVKACDLCDRYGLDTVSTGVTIAWAMECFERGILPREAAGGLDLTWGNHEAVVALVERIGRRESGLGDLLAEGTRRASEDLGQGSEAFAMHVKGLELAGYDPRGLPTYALGLAVSRSGSCHHSGPGDDREATGAHRLGAVPGRAEVVRDLEDRAAVLDSLMICKFLSACFEDFWGEAAHVYTVATGLPMSVAALHQAGERAVNLEKAFNLREGWTAADDCLPDRLCDEPLPDGISAGAVVSREGLVATVQEYYTARGWTAQGAIPAGKLAELGLTDLDECLGGLVPREAGV